MSDKVASEAEFRKAIILQAKRMGCEQEVKQLFNRYDSLLKHCTNQKERKSIAHMGIVELYKLMDCYGGLSVNGNEIIPADNN